MAARMTPASESPRPFARYLVFLRRRFSPEGAFGLHLTIGLVVMLAGYWIFAEIAEEIQPESGVVALDLTVTNWFYGHNTPALTLAARVVTAFGSVAFLSGAFIGLALLLWRQEAWHRLVVLASAMIGGSLLNIALKHFYARERPILENPLVTLTSYGFPSGHTMGATIFFGLLALFALYSRRRPRWQRMLAVLLAGIIVLAIGLTRIYLGAHYLTDVLAAFAAGAVWLAICWAAAETLRKHRQGRKGRVRLQA